MNISSCGDKSAKRSAVAGGMMVAGNERRRVPGNQLAERKLLETARIETAPQVT